MQQRGWDRHAVKLGAIARGDFIAEKLDNIRFHVKVKISGVSRNLELVQRSIVVVTRKMYRSICVAGAEHWAAGPTREQVALDEDVTRRHGIGAASAELAGKRPKLLTLAIKLDEMLATAASAGMVVASAGGVYSESARVRHGRGVDPELDGEGSDEDPADEEADGDGAGEGADGANDADDLEGGAEGGGGELAEGDPGAGGEGYVHASLPYMVRLDPGGFTLRRPKLGGHGVLGAGPFEDDLTPNSAIMMPIVNQDFSRGKTLEDVSHCAARWCRGVDQPGGRLPIVSDAPPGEIDCPMEAVSEDGRAGVPLLVDGNPSFQSLSWFSKPVIKLSRTYFAAGGWHLCKAALKHLCRLFDHLLVLTQNPHPPPPTPHTLPP